jgi:hypothetical protein
MVNKKEHSTFKTQWEKVQTLLFRPVNGASLAAFRFALGLVMSLEAYSLVRPNTAAISTGLSPLQTYYTSPEIKFHLPLDGFGWVPLLPAQWIHLLVGLQALAGLAMALGFCYRISAPLVFLTWGYLFVVESTRTYWQSHYYLETLLTFLMIWTPAARRYSIDAWLTRRRNRPRTVPYWSLVLLRGQLVIAYFYAGVAKLNADWLLDAIPTRWILAEASATTPSLAFAKGILQSTWFAYFISYAGGLFDLSVGFLLLFRRTRLIGMVLLVLFHAINHFIIFDDIGWFPLVGVTTAFIFLKPDWPERLLNRFREAPKGKAGKAGKRGSSPADSPLVIRYPTIATSFTVLWLLWQAFLPLRHLLIRGDSRFTYESQSFSWRLKADVRHSAPAEIYIHDAAIISPASGTNVAELRVNWREWHAGRVLYRRVTPGRINWESLPEIVVTLEPIIGERVIYNPYTKSSPTRAEAASRERVRAIWQSRYGRQPSAVNPSMGLTHFLNSVAEGLKAGGNSAEAAAIERFAVQSNAADHRRETNSPSFHEPMLDLLMNLHRRDRAGAMRPLFHSLPPFTLTGEPNKPAPFLVIDDPVFLNYQRHSAEEPLVIYTTDLGPAGKELLPQVCIFDSQDEPGHSPYIWWNTAKDLTASKLIHISTQPFYLRRYARRVAELWEHEYGRRPIVNAVTSMSLNGRPAQPFVDPAADLATVQVAPFRHNWWIKDLETPRTPRSAIASHPGFTAP